MKKITLFFGAILVTATLLFVACGKDKEKDATINKFFRVENATLVSEQMPDANSDDVISVTMNQNVIPGGSSYVSVKSDDAARKILIGMKGQTGYYELTPSTKDHWYSFVLLVEQNITLDEGQTFFTVQVAIEEEDGDISQIWETSVNLMTVGTGALQVSLSFDNAKDVDLHLIEPNYTNAEGDDVSFYGRHIYYGHEIAPSGGELDLDSNPGCYIDNINNENITYSEDNAFVPAGTYKVYVDLYDNCDESIATNYVVTVFYGGNLIASRSGIFEVGAEGTYNPISEDYVEEVDPFLTFTIGNNGQKCEKTFAPIELTETAKEKEANAAHK